MGICVKGYELIKQQPMEALNSVGMIYRHKKSGARIVVLSNDDDNKVFSIGFRTPPKDSTGVAHIIEHTVLCGSEKFPAKDPFIELAKGSLNTFLNAMTYPDKTVYPVASCNDKDFANLMDVYLDAVFHPNIYRNEMIFKQEGWHYELRNPEDPITLNGVVYNEMKGAFSSPEQKLDRLIQQSLLPNTPYGAESGGDPKHIPELSYEQFLNFHRTYYHASNSFIYLYGDMDVTERLEWLDEQYLSSFSCQEVDSRINLQEPFQRMQELADTYPVSEEESLEEKTYLSYNQIIGTSLEPKLYLAFQILEYALLSAPGAPVKQALLDAGIGKDVLSYYDNGILQPIFSITVKNAEEEQKKAFVQCIRDSLIELAKKGIDRRTLEGAVNYYEFRYREADFGQYPKGLMYGLQILDSWLYDDEKPFIHIKADDTFAFLKNEIGTGYYERLISEYLLDNTHSSLVVLRPEAGGALQEEKRLEKALEEYKQSLSQEKLQQLIAETEALEAYEMTPASEEENEKIPLLSIEDIRKKIHRLYNVKFQIQDVPVMHHLVFTNGIGYLRMSFDITDYGSAGCYLGFLATALGYMDTDRYSFTELANEINIHTGGMSADINIYNYKDNSGGYSAKFEIKAKMFYHKLPQALELIEHMLHHTIFDNDKRLREIISESRSRMEMRMASKGHATAVDRAMSYFSESALFEELTGGMEYYDFIKELDQHFEEKKEELKRQLAKWAGSIFRKDALIVSYTAEEKGYAYLEESLPAFLDRLHGQRPQEELLPLRPQRKNEGFTTSGQVQYVARCGNYGAKGLSYTGTLRVVRVILNYDYMWNHIRVKGGAYGCMCGFSMDGKGYFASYRDPNLKETDEVYRGVADYIANFQASGRDMTKYVIGAISALDTPLTPSGKGSRSFAAYLCRVSEEDLQRERDEVLSASLETIRATAPIMKAIYDEDALCVVGNEKKIQEAGELFMEIRNMNL